MIHELKLEPEYFELTAEGKKPYEIRMNDRNYQAGNYLALNEYDGRAGYTGRSILAKITNIFDDERWCKEGYVILSLDIKLIEGGGIEQWIRKQ